MNVTAHAQRADGWWAVDVPEVPGLFTQVRRLDLVAEAVRNAAQMLGAEVDEVTPDVDPDDDALGPAKYPVTQTSRCRRWGPSG